VLAGVPPEPVNVDDVKKMYSNFRGQAGRLSPEAHEALQMLDAILRAHAQFERQGRVRVAHRAVRRVQLGHRDRGDKDRRARSHDGNRQRRADARRRQVGSWNRQRGTYLDQKRLAADKPEIVDQATRRAPLPSLRLKKGKKKCPPLT
jgi:hypothetical protein